jgi:hypothetical protein
MARIIVRLNGQAIYGKARNAVTLPIFAKGLFGEVGKLTAEGKVVCKPLAIGPQAKEFRHPRVVPGIGRESHHRNSDAFGFGVFENLIHVGIGIK